MAVREFSDEQGLAWRAWDVTPESINPRTKAEDYVADCYRDGWIVFETIDGRLKRRLCPVPAAWATLDDAQLRALLAEAEVVAPRRSRPSARRSGGGRASGETRADDARPSRAAMRGGADISLLGAVRSFKYPGGRVWTVFAHERHETGSATLRFTSGARTLDLADWPRDWADYNEEQLVELLRSVAPRGTTWVPGAPRRRWNDPRP